MVCATTGDLNLESFWNVKSISLAKGPHVKLGCKHLECKRLTYVYVRIHSYKEKQA